MGDQPFGKRTMVTYGPPGTGKTTRVLDLLDTELQAGVPPEEIAFTSFTRAATQEAAQRAAERFRLPLERFPWFRTLHSVGFRLLGLRRNQVYQREHHREFCRRYHYQLTWRDQGVEDDWLGAPVRRTRDDNLRAAHEWSLHRMISLEESWRRGPVRVDRAQLEDYARRYEDFKTEKGLCDFHDMMVMGMDMAGPRVQVAFVDEAQDLSPRQVEACRIWFSNCERVYLAGDPDQTLYSFIAADPTWLIALKEQAEASELLDKSYRVPDKIRLMAKRVIARNRKRIKNPYKSAKPGGRIFRMRRVQAFVMLSEMAKHTGWSGFILVRNRAFVRPVLELLVRARVPFRSEIGGKSPLDRTSLVKACMSAKRYCDKGELGAKDIVRLARYVAPDLIPGAVADRARKEKAIADRNRLILDWGLSSLVEALDILGPAMVLTREPYEVRSYLRAVLQLYGAFPDTPPVTITTIHGAKGREADTVVVLPDMATASYRDFSKKHESENRVAYVAITRAKKELIVCEPETRQSYPYLEYLQ